MAKKKTSNNMALILGVIILIGASAYAYTYFMDIEVNMPWGGEGYPTYESSLGAAWYDQAFATVYEDTYEGNCFRHWDGPIAWAWEDNDCILAEIQQYKNTGNMAYLNKARENLQYKYDLASDCDQEGLGGNEFDMPDGFLDFRCVLGGTSATYLDQSRMFNQFATYVTTVYDEDVTTHMPNADLFKDFVLTQYLEGELDMKGTNSMFYDYEIDGEKRGFFTTSRNPLKACNNNRCAALYETLVYAYEWTGDNMYKDKYERWSNYFRAVMELRSDTPHFDQYYTWHYYDDDPELQTDQDFCLTDPDGWMCMGRMEMGGYGEHDIRPVLAGYERGLGDWKSIDMKILANTYTKAATIIADVYTEEGILLHGNWSVTGWYGEVPAVKDWVNEFRATGKMPTWARLGIVDEEAFHLAERQLKPLYDHHLAIGSYWRPNYYRCVDDPRDGLGDAVCTDFDNDPGKVMLTLANLRRMIT